MSKFLDLDGLNYFADKIKTNMINMVNTGPKNLIDCRLETLKTTNSNWTDNVWYGNSGKVKITANLDDTITLETTATTTAVTFFHFGNVYIRAGVEYRLYGYNAVANVLLRVGDTWADYGNSIHFTPTTAQAGLKETILRVDSGITITTPVTFKPLLCENALWNISNTFVPYRPY